MQNGDYKCSLKSVTLPVNVGGIATTVTNLSQNGDRRLPKFRDFICQLHRGSGYVLLHSLRDPICDSLQFGSSRFGDQLLHSRVGILLNFR